MSSVRPASASCLVMAINDGSPDASSGTLVIPKSAPCVGESLPIGRGAAYAGGVRGGSGRRTTGPGGDAAPPGGAPRQGWRERRRGPRRRPAGRGGGPAGG